MQATIDSSDFNAKVPYFLSRYGPFPIQILAKLAGVDMPEPFA